MVREIDEYSSRSRKRYRSVCRDTDIDGDGVNIFVDEIQKVKGCVCLVVAAHMRAGARARMGLGVCSQVGVDVVSVSVDMRGMFARVPACGWAGCAVGVAGVLVVGGPMRGARGEMCT